jgi:hypothetical protein
MDDWGFEQIEPWLLVRQSMSVGPLFCVSPAVAGPAAVAVRAVGGRRA